MIKNLSECKCAWDRAFYQKSVHQNTKIKKISNFWLCTTKIYHLSSPLIIPQIEKFLMMIILMIPIVHLHHSWSKFRIIELWYSLRVIDCSKQKVIRKQKDDFENHSNLVSNCRASNRIFNIRGCVEGGRVVKTPKEHNNTGQYGPAATTLVGGSNK